ncbi:MAG: ABC transporter substrate binding protein [Pseudomonadota bacterium]
MQRDCPPHNGLRRLLLASAALPFAARAAPARPLRIACLSSSKADPTPFDAFRAALAVVDPALAPRVSYTQDFAGFDSRHLAALAQALNKGAPDLLLCFDFDAALAAVAARRSAPLPIVFRAHEDPLERGLIDSYARPGRRITGITTYRCIDDKLVEIIRDALPSARRIGFVRDAAIPDSGCNAKAQQYARSRGIELLDFSISAPRELPSLMERIRAARPDALVVTATAVTWQRRRQVIDGIDALALPALYEGQVFVDDGALMHFGSVQHDAFERLAKAAAHVLRGGAAGDFPVSQPVHFELLVNLKARHAASYKLSPQILRRADRILE